MRKGLRKGRKERPAVGRAGSWEGPDKWVGRREDGIEKAEKREKVVLGRRLDWV